MKFHMSLPARDLDETVRFYSDLFGEDPTKRKDDFVKFDPKSVPINLTFHPVGDEQSPDLSRHLGFQVETTEEFDRVHERLSRWIVEKREEGICCYGRQDKFWVQDPTGFRWEVYRLLEDTDVKGGSRTHEPSRRAACC